MSKGPITKKQYCLSLTPEYVEAVKERIEMQSFSSHVDGLLKKEAWRLTAMGEKSCPYEHGTVCTFDVAKLSDCQNPKKCKPREVEKP